MKKQSKSIEQIHDRIALVMRTLKYDESSFARKIGASKAAVMSVVSKRSDPSFAMIKNITQILPVEQKWLFMGDGEMWTTKDLSVFKSEAKVDMDHRHVDEEINNRVKMIRMNSGYTQLLFARELAVPRDVVTNIETYKSSPSAVFTQRLCRAFMIDANWVILGEGEMYTKKK